MNDVPLHIALGDSAAGLLRRARANLGLPGVVFSIPDELSHGPLHDGRARSVYFKTRIYGHAPDVPIPDNAFGCWHTLSQKIRSDQPDTIVVWTSDAISDMIFLRMACWHLRDFGGDVASVNTSKGRASWYGVGINSPEMLVAQFANRVVLDAVTRADLAQAFEEIVERNDLLRVYRDGNIVSANSDHFDNYVMSFVTRDWERAVRIVGNCLGHSIDENMISDAFFEWRLQTLLGAGKLEAQGDLSRMNGYQVRLPPGV